MASLGYDDTPLLPGSKWRVHDISRPHPRVVTPGAGNEPPSDAVVLFDATNLDEWRASDGSEAKWKIEGDHMEVTKTGDIHTVEQFGDCQLHLEWASPSVVEGDSQGRGNSGVFLMGLYEIQVLDGYDNPTYADGLTGAIYGQYPPFVNACRAPGEWQSYDVIFEAPRWQGGKLSTPAFMTIIHNGVLLHHRQEIQGPTGHGNLASYDPPHDAEGPLSLQDHGGDLVRYRNIWMRRLSGYDAES